MSALLWQHRAAVCRKYSRALLLLASGRNGHVPSSRRMSADGARDGKGLVWRTEPTCTSPPHNVIQVRPSGSSSPTCTPGDAEAHMQGVCVLAVRNSGCSVSIHYNNNNNDNGPEKQTQPRGCLGVNLRLKIRGVIQRLMKCKSVS